MSSRALRRAQKELEEKQIQEKLAQEEQDNEESEEEVAPKATAKPSLFALLGDGGNEDEDEDEDDSDQEVGGNGGETDPEPVATPAPKSSRKSKKKKKKGKAKGKPEEAEKKTTPTRSSSGLDEIDQALLALKLTSKDQGIDAAESGNDAVTEEKRQLFSVLSIDTQHLHAANEMKKLFGRAALQVEEEPRPRGQGGLVAQVAGRNPAGRNLKSIGLRRNIFIQGKEEWPRATSGGLGMEVVEKRPDGSVEYRFVHNSMYQDVQRDFQACVRSMDPERMVQLLHKNRMLNPMLQSSQDN